MTAATRRTARTGGTRTLHLLRHAKSSWDDRSLRDHDRPLAPRGLLATGVLRRHFAANDFGVELVLCSTAVRARQTWEGVAAGVTGAPRLQMSAQLYDAGPDDLLAVLRGVPDPVTSVLLVGHNPAIEELAAGLNDDEDSAAARRLAEKYPTGALATLTLERPWRELGYGRARLRQFLRPRDLPPV